MHFGYPQLLYLVLLVKVCVCDYEMCDRRPLGTNTAPLPPDNRFLIEIDDIREDRYIPRNPYKVRLKSRDMVTTFIAFTISLREDTKYNKNNPRKPLLLNPGRLAPLPNANDTQLLTSCKNTVTQSDITPKTSVEALWTAPEKDNKCVTIYAVVAVRPDVWYSYEGPLSKRVCEDRRKADDMQPIENENCQACEDARYQLTFEGMWSYNTHPAMFPSARELAKFSDVVGASHSKDYTIFKYNFEASPGLQLLAEQGNTTNLEVEITDRLGADVRTILKATAPPRPDAHTITTFRTSRKHHLVSLATALMPSPDWFLGVSNFELCDAKTNEWANNVTYNLYPMDAGTDSGKKFDSSNEATAPAQPITAAEIATNVPKEQVKPFARLIFHLIRTYYKPNCTSESEVTDEPTDTNNGEGDGSEEGSEPYSPPSSENNRKNEYRPAEPPSTTSEEPPVIDSESTARCPVSQWGPWQECEGECIDKTRTGYQIRMRTLFPEAAPDCDVSLTDMQPCEEECEENEQQEGYDEYTQEQE